jgi:phosphatidylglycerol:prolipoprotein diacylglycerol transferase
MFFTIVLSGISSVIVTVLGKESEEDKKEIDDIYFILVLIGFIGARLSYALMHIDLYKGNMFNIFKISESNLSLVGGLIFGLVTLGILSRKYKIKFDDLLKIFVIPFYFSISIGIWVVVFNKFLLPISITNSLIKIAGISFIFLIGMILELMIPNKKQYKYKTPIILAIIMGLYRLIIFLG